MTTRHKPSKTLGLCMIVKNEADIILDCLRSISDYLDYWVIYDTGSTDGTQDIIRNYFEEVGISGKLVESEWVNFGYNRTEALVGAYKTADYLILLDADFIVNVIDKDFKYALSDKNTGYLIKYTGDLDYKVIKLVSGNVRWEYIGVTHEYIDTKESMDKVYFDSISIDHKLTGSSRSDKFSRDIAMLTKALKDDPANVRNCFYLAQSYKDIGENEKAIQWYTKRVELGGWDEEVYYSLYSIGLCRESAGYDFDSVVVFDYLRAFNFRRSRLEALYHIVKYYRTTEQYTLAFSYAMMGWKTPYPDDILFVAKGIHKYKFLDELSISAYWVGFHQLGYNLGKRILKDNFHSEEETLRLEKNLNFCKNGLMLSSC